MLLIHLLSTFLAVLRVSRLPSTSAALAPVGPGRWRGGCELKARYPPRAVLSRGSGRTIQSEDRLVNVSVCQYVQSEPKRSL
jgi:hypothetical protein